MANGKGTAGTAVEETSTSNGVVTYPPAVLAMLEDIHAMAAQAGSENAAQVSLDIMEQILTADSLEEAAGSTTDIEDILQIGVDVTVKQWLKSDIGELGVFAVLEVAFLGGTADPPKVVTCGGRNIVAIMYRAQKEGRQPLRGMFRQVSTGQGYKTLRFDVIPV